MGSVLVNTDLLRELLNAAARTARAHRGSDVECYVLGQLEATANFAYVLAAGSGDDELELLCQQLALDALNRHSEMVCAGDRVAKEPEKRTLSRSS